MSGMTSETEIVEFKQGNDRVVRKKPGRTTYSNIVLERGFLALDGPPDLVLPKVLGQAAA